MAFLVLVGALQFVYCVLVGNYVSFSVFSFSLFFCGRGGMGGRDGGESALGRRGRGECEKRAWKSRLFFPPCSLPLFERSAYPFSSYSPSTLSFPASALPSASSSSRLVSASRPTLRIRQSSRASAMSGEFLSRFLRRDFLQDVITGGEERQQAVQCKIGVNGKEDGSEGEKK